MKKRTNVVIDDKWVHPLAKTLHSLVSNFWWNTTMDNWNLDENIFGKWQFLQHYKSITPQKIYKERQIMLG